VNHSRPLIGELENGMKAAGSVMKAAGGVMKVRTYLSASYVNLRVIANEGLLLNVSRKGLRKRICRPRKVYGVYLKKGRLHHAGSSVHPKVVLPARAAAKFQG
jgi:hypothetical protein